MYKPSYYIIYILEGFKTGAFWKGKTNQQKIARVNEERSDAVRLCERKLCFCELFY